jgi:glycosyltransferase involved in cell wall biosynthesis
MIIAVVTETYWPQINGVAMTLHRLVTGLANRGHQIQLICPHLDHNRNDGAPRNILRYPVKGYPLPGYKDVMFGLPSNNLLKSLWLTVRPDVVYVATEGPLGWSAVRQANKLNIPVTSGFHTNFHSYSRHYRLGFLRHLVQRYLVGFHNMTKTTIVPTNQQKTVLESMGIRHVSVMGRGVDTELFSPTKRSTELRARWGVTGADPVMLYVGRIALEKNLGLTIDTYYSLRRLNDKIKFVLVGDGPLSNKLKKQHPDFIFSGSCTGDELAAHYASGDLFVFSSLTETFGNVILEAMASGLGVVAFDYAAAHIHIKTDENGVLAQIGDAQGFIDNADRVIQNQLLLKKLRVNAGKYAACYSWDSIVEQFEGILALHTNTENSAWKDRSNDLPLTNR